MAIGQASIAAACIDRYLAGTDQARRPKVDVHHFDLLEKLREASLSPDEYHESQEWGTCFAKYAVHNFEDRSTQEIIPADELFLGHCSHQSARYRITHGSAQERQSSSGIIISTGTGATGWARSIHRSRNDQVPLPGPEDEQLAYYVREAFPSVSTGTDICSGTIQRQESLEVRSEMNENGVIFGDGIETDFLDFNWGRQVSIGVAERTLELVIA